MDAAPNILYLATNVFSKGGIQRYSRAQIQALRDLFGEKMVTSLVVKSASGDAFEEPFAVDYVGGGKSSLVRRVRFILRSFQFKLRAKPDVVWSNHVRLLPMAEILKRCGRPALSILNVYGLEVWSGLSRFEKWALGSVDHVVSDCYSTAEYLETRLGVPTERISVIWDPVDTKRFEPRNTAAEILPRYGVPYSPDTCYVLTLGRISRDASYKGYDRIIDAIKTLDGYSVVYLLAGDGDDRSRLEERVEMESLQKRIYFMGSIPENDLVQVYNACDVFALISDRGPGRGEGVPLTPLEAAACAKPIIVGDEDGSAEAVEAGITGYIVSPHDQDAIHRALLKLVESRDLRESMGRNARQHIVKCFDYRQFKSKTAHLIGDLQRQRQKVK